MASAAWKQKYKDRIVTAETAMKRISPGDRIFIGTGCGKPQHLVDALVHHTDHVDDAHVIHLLTIGSAPWAEERFREKFKMNSFFIAENVRSSLEKGIGDYTPIFLSDIPGEFESGRLPIDVALVSVTPPDANGLCSLGVSVDIVKSAVENARCVIAQVNHRMPRTLGNSFIPADRIDCLVPFDEEILEVPPPASDETLKRIGENLATLVEDGSTIECGIGRIPQALVETLKHKKDLGVHTEMFGDWLLDLVKAGVVTGAKKTVNRGKIVASFCMGTRRLYDFVDNNPAIEFHPTETVNDPALIARHDKMVAINVGLEIDLSGQVCADSLGYRFYSGIGGQVDFNRGAARSSGGKAIIALPSTAMDGTVSRIVPHLTEGAGVVTTRGDVHYVVTEFGIAYLHGKSIRERVLSLVNIAHPKFRNELLQAAKAQRYIYQDQIEMAWDQMRYPKELERHEILRDGTQIFFRPVKPTDEPAIREMFYSLSAESVRSRYFTHTARFPHREVQQVANVDYRQDLAVAGVVPGPSGETIVAIAQYFLDPRSGEAEVAFVVQDEWQKRGMGTFLLRFISETAHRRGVKRFTAKVLPGNKAMLAVFHNSGYPVATEFSGDAYSLSYPLDRDPAAPEAAEAP
ncbi:MAG: GNAT family N-acetyltransferase [Planctomycetota bacterium]